MQTNVMHLEKNILSSMEIIEQKNKKNQSKTNPAANELGTSFTLKERAATVAVHVMHL